MVLKRKKKSKAAPAGLIAGATGAAGAIAGYVLRRRRRDRDAEPPAGAAAATPASTPADESLNTPTHDTGDAVMPDVSSDPLVDEQTNAAAAQAGQIGGNVNFPEDPATRASEEGSGDSAESFESGTEEAGR